MSAGARRSRGSRRRYANETRPRRSPTGSGFTFAGGIPGHASLANRSRPVVPDRTTADWRRRNGENVPLGRLPRRLPAFVTDVTAGSST